MFGSILSGTPGPGDIFSFFHYTACMKRKQIINEKQIKLIACDMDGTLLDDQKNITTGNKEAVQRLKNDTDVRFVIATGRHDSMIGDYMDELGIDMPVISCNGALIREPRSGKLYSAVALDTEHILEVIRICKEFGADYHIYEKDVIYGEALTGKMVYYKERNKILSEGRTINLVVDPDYENFIRDHEGSLLKVLILPVREEDFAPISDEIAARTGLTAFQSDRILLDVMQKGISKASAIETLCRELEIEQHETAAIGDQLNDLDMIEYAGTGVAMNNAVPRIKDAAQLVTENCNNNSGVAEALGRLVGNLSA